MFLSTVKRIHPWFFSGLCIVTLFAASLTSSAAPAIWLLAVTAALGAPHGALDLVLAYRAGLFDSYRQTLAFFATYLALAGLTALLWVTAPALALSAFLALSAWHFGADWPSLRRDLRFLAGAAVVSLPAVSHQPAVADIFAVLVHDDPDSGRQIAAALHILGHLGIVAALLVASRNVRKRLDVSLELASITAVGLLLEPLAYFALYFCALHGLRHTLVAVSRCEVSVGRVMLWTAGALVAVTAVGFVGLYQFSNAHLEVGLLLVIFIGLSTLTVPHVALMTYCERVVKLPSRSARSAMSAGRVVPLRATSH